MYFLAIKVQPITTDVLTWSSNDHTKDPMTNEWLSVIT